MARAKTLLKPKKSLKNTAKNLIEYDPIDELKDENFIGKAILECLINNDPEGVMEVIGIYLSTLEKNKFVQDAQVPKSTLYHSLKSKNPTIKTLAKIVHATKLDTENFLSQALAKK
jgi:DNA-binding phage protein